MLQASLRCLTFAVVVDTSDLHMQGQGVVINWMDYSEVRNVSMINAAEQMIHCWKDVFILERVRMKK